MGVETNPWARDIPASLIRRLGEAADGFRGSSDAYYLVALKPDAYGHHKVFGPYVAMPSASDLPKETSSEDFGWFGPVRTPATISRPTFTIEKLDLRTSKTTLPTNVTIDGPDFDCLFYSLSAVEKFAIPYYARMYGGDYVNKLLASFRKSNLHLMGHLPGTEYQIKTARRAEPTTKPCSPGIAAVIRMEEDGALNRAVIEPIVPESKPELL
jgi:hypothetical protein